MKTLHDETQLNWHLKNNVFGLSPKAIEGILKECEYFNKGEKTTASYIDTIETEEAGDCDEYVTLGELFDDLKIEITE